ncbi:sugar phosphate isomerase/epimerase family protein [Paenibacillus cremeus]|uniref:Sugar phosphate isomerase/epimerase n=1 Tax=Paenibacillus cremeus TaxID=2163881 RepID=A0A559KH12_9BACL|nr:sugar phosphate isomerase/epimerase [Paenibacillus cremeus]TVY11425.1 sugar phosphate isomerase/epimerase [Paenibacillus cremeus]
MRLSTTTGTFSLRLDGGYTPYKESIRRCKAAGYDVLDINFCRALTGQTDLVNDNWVQLVHELRDEAEKLGIAFSQSHPVFLPAHPNNTSAEKLEVYNEMMQRSIVASSILGVQWAVVHPHEDRAKTALDFDACIKDNVEHFSPYVELAVKHNVGIAFENMIERPTSMRRFCSHATELAAMIDVWNEPKVGACWDFGHANFLYKDQRSALRTLGKRLKAMHVNDNYGSSDEHMFPFHGSVDWPTLLPVLAEIGYEGDFTYETHKEFNGLPEAIKDSLAKIGYDIAEYCLSLVNPS